MHNDPASIEKYIILLNSPERDRRRIFQKLLRFTLALTDTEAVWWIDGFLRRLFLQQ